MKSIIQTVQKGTDSLKEIVVIYLSTVLVGAVLFSILEKVGLFNSIYWSFITTLSIGYGDFSPHTTGGKILTIILANFVLLFIIPMFIGHSLHKLIPDRNEFTDEEQEEIKTTLRKIAKKNGIR